MSHVNTLKLHQLRLGELSPAEERALHAHLAECALCAARLHHQQAERLAFSREPMPAALEPKPSWIERLRGWLFPGAVLVPATLAAFFVIQAGPLPAHGPEAKPLEAPVTTATAGPDVATNGAEPTVDPSASRIGRGTVKVAPLVMPAENPAAAAGDPVEGDASPNDAASGNGGDVRPTNNGAPDGIGVPEATTAGTPESAPLAVPDAGTHATPDASLTPDGSSDPAGDVTHSKGLQTRLEAWVQSGQSARPLYLGETVSAGTKVQLRYDPQGRRYVTLAGRDSDGVVDVYGTVPAGAGPGMVSAPFALTLDASRGEQTFFALCTDTRPTPGDVVAAVKHNPVRMDGAVVATVVVRKD